MRMLIGCVTALVLAGCLKSEPKVETPLTAMEAYCLNYMNTAYSKKFQFEELQCLSAARHTLCEYEVTEECVTDSVTFCRVSTKIGLMRVFKECMNHPEETI